VQVAGIAPHLTSRAVRYPHYSSIARAEAQLATQYTDITRANGLVERFWPLCLTSSKVTRVSAVN